MKIFVINGPNLNMLGIREKEIYGHQTYQDLLNLISSWGKEYNIIIECYQSNIEGEIINFIQNAFFEKCDGIIINPAAYTHTSIGILDALKATNLPTVEVHISDVNKREEFRQISYIRDYCIASVIGEGFVGYKHAIEILKQYVEEHHGN